MIGEGLIASPELRAHVDGMMSVCADMDPKTFKDWERLLIPENDPRNWLRKEWQRRNDCCANSGTSGLELMLKRRRNQLVELARTWAYQQCEIIDGKFGADSGVSVPGLIKLFMTLGCTTEALYPYGQYTRNRRQFNAWQTPELLADAETRRIQGSIPAPSFGEACVHVAMGNPIHWGHWWSVPFRNETIAPGVTGRVVRGYRRGHGGGLHATEIVWVIVTPSGERLLVCANSHNDGFFYIPEAEYEAMRDRSFNPCGAYVMLAHEDPIEQYVGQISWLGSGS
jgi:hypothetical protein